MSTPGTAAISSMFLMQIGGLDLHRDDHFVVPVAGVAEQSLGSCCAAGNTPSACRPWDIWRSSRPAALRPQY